MARICNSTARICNPCLYASTLSFHTSLDGADLPNLAPLFEACPVVYFGPESQALIQGPAEERRGFLDWSGFHVEHASLGLWKAWRRALRQRNALLRGRLLAVEGQWQRDAGSGGAVRHLVARRLRDLTPLLGRLAGLTTSRDFH